ncbi:MAG: HipA domain-containing protein [Candidatus Berkiellales bacterium]
MRQSIDQAIDLKTWRRDEELAAYPEGARDKTLLYCPTPAPFGFLRAEHRYLFKRSSPRYPEQFWMEIVAYRLGVLMDVPVPPAFVAFDSKENQTGALIEWFLNKVDFGDEIFVPGGDYCQQIIPNFDRKRGKQHNFESVAQILTDLNQKYDLDWKTYWAKAFTFDALIGNTDRHQDNWGIIINPINHAMQISPVFDNGTSLGHEITADNFEKCSDLHRLQKYIAKGWHHMKWRLNDDSPCGHVELIQKFLVHYPETRSTILNCLTSVNDDIFKNILDEFTAFNVPVKLTHKRADFMLKLLQLRHQQLLNELFN